MHGLIAVGAIVVGQAAPASAQDAAADHVARYEACPAFEVWRFYEQVGPATRSPDKPDQVMLGPLREVETWPGDPNWRAPEPMPAAALGSIWTWRRPATALARHRALRERQGRPMPVGERRILLFESSNHWVRVERSIIATRSLEGVWRIDTAQAAMWQAGDEVWVADEALSPENGARLDAILADPCLALEPLSSTFSHTVSSENALWVLEVEGQGDDLRIAGGHQGFGRAGAIYLLLNPIRSQDAQ